MSEQYTINGTLNFDEYLECHKILAEKRRLWARSIITLYGIGAILYGTFITESGPSLPIIIIGAIFATYGICISPIQFRFRVKRNWDRYPRMKKEFNITILEDGLQAIDDKGNPSHTAWDNFLRFQESEHLFLLYMSPSLPLCIPKRLIPDGERGGLRSLLSSSIGKRIEGEQVGTSNGG
jgi:hypothetical protein